MIVTYPTGYYLAVNDFDPSIRSHARTLAAASVFPDPRRRAELRRDPPAHTIRRDSYSRFRWPGGRGRFVYSTTELVGRPRGEGVFFALLARDRKR